MRMQRTGRRSRWSPRRAESCWRVGAAAGRGARPGRRLRKFLQPDRGRPRQADRVLSRRSWPLTRGRPRTPTAIRATEHVRPARRAGSDGRSPGRPLAMRAGVEIVEVNNAKSAPKPRAGQRRVHPPCARSRRRCGVCQGEAGRRARRPRRWPSAQARRAGVVVKDLGRPFRGTGAVHHLPDTIAPDTANVIGVRVRLQPRGRCRKGDAPVPRRPGMPPFTGI